MLPPFKPGVFHLDAYDGQFPGYSRGQGWNGWATPVFEKKAVLAMIDVMGEGENPLSFDEEKDAAAWYSADWEETIFYESAVIEVDGTEVTVYPVGTREWTWEEIR